jgi:hypothetical protein
MVRVRWRHTAEKQISQVPTCTANIIAAGVDIGPYSSHRFAKEKPFNKSVIIDSARIIRMTMPSNGRWNRYKYFIVGLSCEIHGESTIMPIGMQYLNFYKDPCIECAIVDPIGDLALEIGWDCQRVRVAFKRGETIEEIRKRASYCKSNAAVIRRSASRRTQLPKDTSFADRVQFKLEFYRESSDPREEKLTKLLTTLDISQAQITGSRPRKVFGLSCKVHPELEIPGSEVGTLLVGSNPCKSCQSETRSSSRKSKPRPPKWTTSSLRERLTNDLSPGLEHIDFTSMIVEPRGSKSTSYVTGIRCVIHDKIVPPRVVCTLFNHPVRCGECKRAAAYSLEEILEMVQFAHSGVIKLLDYGGRVTNNSVFECLQCNHVWRTKVYHILGSKNRMPSGCPRCAKTHLVNESAVAHRLVELYQEIICDEVCILLPGTFARQVVLPSSNRPLFLDFLVGIPDLGTWGIEVDGDQHYGEYFYGTDHSKITARDIAKVKACTNQGIQVARLPLLILPTLDHVFKELDEILAGRAKYQGIPQQSWIEDH